MNQLYQFDPLDLISSPQQYRQLCSLAYRITTNIQDAEDAVQSTFLYMCKRREKRLVESETRAIAQGVIKVKNVAIDLVRQINKRKSILHETSNMPTTFQGLEELSGRVASPLEAVCDVNEMVYELVESLPSRQREVVTYTYWHDMTVREIAIVLRVGSSTVQRELTAAKRTLCEMWRAA